ncbi:hypothetical protein HCU66_16620 [Pseudomonas frederiksbergensis]|uniref:hypothetical protein n=1 Tax=Pseudomonas frederiksbergensis TaxID=104087 RepID=UPI00197E1158|nr:hypothetical protein [Pseudomonas frederiksbergensis]MBN3863864.1 hypothetical protein [Pseudomonas frederiksbergensis]
MSVRAIDTDHSFVKNGDQTEGFDHWDDVSTQGERGLRGDWWGDVYVMIMTLADLAAVRQTMKVPIAQQADARYRVRVLYENTYPSSAGQVVVNKKGSIDTFVIPLPAKSGAQAADPLAVDLTEVEEELPDRLDLQAGDELELKFCSPKKIPGDGGSAEIRLTGIWLKLSLPPLELVAFSIDGRHFTPADVLPLCLGATGDQSHGISFEKSSASGWDEGSLWLYGNPLGAITGEPDLGKTQLINLPWWLDCPNLGGDEPNELTMKIHSKYTAQPYPLRVSLGHHLLELIALKQAETHPVIEYGESVELQVQVRSVYTQAPVVREVIWRIEGEGKTILHRAPTDAQGRATYPYTPTEAGLSRITASVVSPLSENGEATHTFDVLAFATDPLKTLQARFDDGPPALWGEKTRYPERGESFRIYLDIPADHPLHDAEFFLFWGEGDLPADLGATALPDFGHPAVVVGGSVLWTLNFGGSRDGFFGLVIGCSRLQRPSRSNAMSLAYNRVEIGETWGPNKSPVVDEGDVVTCAVQVQRSDRQPVSNVEVRFETPVGSVKSLTGVDGWASVDHQPDNADESVITARVQRHEDAPVLEHPFSVKTLPVSSWKGQVTFTLDGKPIDRVVQGVICRRGRTHRLRIDPVEGSSFIGKSIALDWGEVEPLSGFEMDPQPGIPRTMGVDGLEWKITSGIDISGFSTLRFSSSHLTETREFPLRLLASDLATEVRAMLDHVSAESGNDTLFPCLWAKHQLVLMPHGISALHGLPMKSDITPLPPGMVAVPPLSTDVVMTAGGARRELDFTNSSDNAEMTLTKTVVIGDELLTAQTPLNLDHNKIRVVAARGPAIDPVLSKDESVRLQARFYSAFADRPVPNARVGWQVGSGAPVDSLTDVDGWAMYDARSTQAGLSEASATANNPFDQSKAEQCYQLNTLAGDPWPSLRLVTDSLEQLWAQRALFPRRGEAFNMRLQADVDSALLGQSVAVGLVSPGQSEVGLVFADPLGEFREVTEKGLDISFNAGDLKDSGLAIQLAASRLLERSAPQPMSLGSQAIAANITASPGVLQVVDWGKQVLCEVRLTSGVTGRPMANVRIKWTRLGQEPTYTTTDFHGRARISFLPPSSGPGIVTASVVGGADSASVNIHYSMNEPRRIEALVVDAMSGFPGQKVSAFALVVSAITGKALPDAEVHWRQGNLALPSTLTDAQGKATIEFWLLPGQVRLTASVRSGLAGTDAQSVILSAPQDKLVVAELNSDKTTFWLGETMTAQARVLYEQQGGVAPGVPVDWKFPPLQSRMSMTDDKGLAEVEVTAPYVGVYQLAAFVRETAAGSKTLNYEVLDPLDSPEHANIESVTAAPNPVYKNNWVTMTALIVGTKSRLPMPGRKIFMSRNGQPFFESTTDSNGKVGFAWRPFDSSEQVSLSVKVENPGGGSISDAVYVTVLEI